MYNGNCGSITPEQVVTVFSGVLTPVIAFIVAAIAWQSWETNRAALREKLFDRRFQAFLETQKFLSEISANMTFSQDSFWKFTGTCQRSRFLFGVELQEYLHTIRSRSLQLKLARSNMDDPNEQLNRPVHVAQHTADAVWLNSQLDVIPEKFDPFLSFSKHK